MFDSIHFPHQFRRAAFEVASGNVTKPSIEFVRRFASTTNIEHLRERGELRFANAGHPHAFRVGDDGDCTRLHAVAPPIGFSSASIDECVMAWRPGDRLVLFTDGLTDARNAADARLGERSLLDRLRRMSHQETPDQMMAALFSVVDAHVGGTALRDDLAAVIVDRLP